MKLLTERFLHHTNIGTNILKYFTLLTDINVFNYLFIYLLLLAFFPPKKTTTKNTCCRLEVFKSQM